MILVLVWSLAWTPKTKSSIIKYTAFSTIIKKKIDNWHVTETLNVFRITKRIKHWTEIGAWNTISPSSLSFLSFWFYCCFLCSSRSTVSTSSPSKKNLTYLSRTRSTRACFFTTVIKLNLRTVLSFLLCQQLLTFSIMTWWVRPLLIAEEV